MWTVENWYAEAFKYGQAKAAQIRQHSGFVVDLYRQCLPGLTDQEIVKRLDAWADERLGAAPSLARYPELRGMRELIQAQWQGTRDGAGMNDLEYAGLRDGNNYYHRFVASGKLAKQQARCSAIFFPESDEGPLFGNNLDTGLGEGFGLPEWPMPNEHLVVGGVSSGVFLDEESPEIFPAPVFKLMGRYARTCDEAVEILTRYNHFWGPGNLLVADRSRRTAMIEKTACRIAVRWSPDGFGYVTAMAQHDPGIKAFVADRRAASLKARGLDPNNCDDVAYWGLQEQRNQFQHQMLQEARKAPSLEWMRRMLQSREPGKGFCALDGEPCRPGVPGTSQLEYTLATKIILLGKKKARWWARDNQRNIPSWNNPMPDHQFPESTLAF